MIALPVILKWAMLAAPMGTNVLANIAIRPALPVITGEKIIIATIIASSRATTPFAATMAILIVIAVMLQKQE